MFAEDEQLFGIMAKESTSENEKTFFERMYNKQAYQPVGTVDVIMNATDNPEHIYIDREGFSEYLIGRQDKDVHYQVHVMCLAEALNVKLSEFGLKDDLRTILDWLRQLDYKGISYDYKEEQ